ncbi:MAG: hypothetical protein JSS08_13520 [Proteobacteria bacterium]|nr:hypothetical protein [Pseudomonadota bacterium]
MRYLIFCLFLLQGTASSAQTSLGNVEVARLCKSTANFVLNIGAAANGHTSLNLDSLLSEKLDDYNLFWAVMSGRSQTAMEEHPNFAETVGQAIACIQKNDCPAKFGQTLIETANKLDQVCRLDYLGL